MKVLHAIPRKHASGPMHDFLFFLAPLFFSLHDADHPVFPPLSLLIRQDDQNTFTTKGRVTGESKSQTKRRLGAKDKDWAPHASQRPGNEHTHFVRHWEEPGRTTALEGDPSFSSA